MTTLKFLTNSTSRLLVNCNGLCSTQQTLVLPQSLSGLVRRGPHHHQLGAAMMSSGQVAPRPSSSNQPQVAQQPGAGGSLKGTSSSSGTGSKGFDGKPKSAGGRVRIYVMAALVGVGGGVAYSLIKAKQEEMTKKSPVKQIGNVAESNIKPFLIEKPPYFEPAKKVIGSRDNQGLKLTLYQYATCPFCCKARAFLDYMGLSYDIVEVNSVMRTQVKWSKYKKVPILVAETPDGQVLQLNDSSMIVSAMYSYIVDPTKSLGEYLSMYPQIQFVDDDGKQKLDMTNKYFIMFQELDVQKRKKDVAQERKWRQWVDNTFVHTLSPNVYRTPQESLQAFRWFNEVGDWEKHFATWERLVVIYIGAMAMWLIGKRLKKRHGLKDDVRQSFYDETNTWLKAVKQKGHTFLGGDKPNLADLAVYGALSAVEGCEAFLDLQANTNIKPWFEAMKKAVKAEAGTTVAHENQTA